MKKSATKKLVIAALFTTLTMLSTLFIRLPLPIGYVHLGDAFVLLSAFLLGPIWGSLAAGMGSALADVFGYVTYAPATLIIKALMALLASLSFNALKKPLKYPVFAQIIAGVLGTLVMAAGYFVYESLLFATVGVAFINLLWSLLQGAVGAVIAILTMHVLTKTSIENYLK